MGSIRARSESNLLFLDFYYNGVRCREQTKLKDTIQNRKRLEKLLERLETAMASDTFRYEQFFPGSQNIRRFSVQSEHITAVPIQEGRVTLPVSGCPLFREFSEIWFAEREVEWRNSYRKGMRADIDKVLIPHFGEMAVDQITKADILSFRAKLSKVTARGKTTMLSTRRINKIFEPLRQILNEAADRFNFRIVFQGVKALKNRKTDIHPFTLDEVSLILRTVRPDYRSYYTVRFFTGMRTAEVDGLKWKYVDFERRLILVRETIVDGEEEYTKNNGSQREIRMAQIVYEALKLQEQATRHLSPYVFCNTTCRPFDHKNVTKRVWYPLLRHLGLEMRRPYHCRHTAATLWLAAGENPEWIARQMGHTTTEMLFRVYSRYVPNLTRQDGSAFERLLLQNMPNDTAFNQNDAEVHHA